MLKRPLLALLVALAAAALIAACGDDDDEAATTEATETTAEAPTNPPLIGGFLDGEEVNYVLTDISDAKEAKGLSEATGYPVTHVTSLADVPEASTAKLYLFMNGVEGPNPMGFQANVLDTGPDDQGYSPLWRVQAVTWRDETAARELRSEEKILEAEQAGELTIEQTPIVKNSPVVPGSKNPPLVGGFYDGREVSYLLTDISDRQESRGLSKATGFPVTFVASLGDVPESSVAKLYLFTNGVEGPNPMGFQANVLDTIPGDQGYSPLWRVQAVTWRDETAARELRSEEEILEAEQAGELTIEQTPIVKNSPVVPSG